MNQPATEQTRWIHANGSSKTAKLEELYPLSWQTINAEECLACSEPTEGAVAAVLFKLFVGAYYPSFSGEILKVLASDVEFFNPQGERQHRLVRKELTPEIESAAIERMIALYTKGPFSVAWILAYALQDYQPQVQADQLRVGSSPKIIELELQADYQALTREEIEDNFLPEANTWLKLIELGQKKATQLRIKNRGEEIASPIDQATAELLIKDKVLPPILFQQLLNNEGKPEVYENGLNSAAYQQIAVSLLGLTESDGKLSL